VNLGKQKSDIVPLKIFGVRLTELAYVLNILSQQENHMIIF
jgi:hypothetical protein